MPEPRKVYIASCKDAAARDASFGFLGDRFDIHVTDPEEAEFIVVDCEDHEPAGRWLSSKPEMVFPKPCRPAFVLVALNGRPNADFVERLGWAYEGDFSVFDVASSPDALLRTLRWIESIVPFYNRKNSPIPAVHELAIAVMKSQMATSPPPAQG